MLIIDLAYLWLKISRRFDLTIHQFPVKAC